MTSPGERAVKERPILFSGPMVRAILEGRKRQTRRIAKDVNEWHHEENPLDKCTVIDGVAHCEVQVFVDEAFDFEFRCPYGKPGDRLWVRETWCSPTKYIVGYAADGICGGWMEDGEGGQLFVHHGRILESPGYSLCFPDSGDRTWGLVAYGGKWKPSIHMPRWASRITLEITGVRIERLNDISEADAMAEGVQVIQSSIIEPYSIPPKRIDLTAVHYFRDLWESINGKGSWGENPWVWVIEFKKVTE